MSENKNYKSFIADALKDLNTGDGADNFKRKGIGEALIALTMVIGDIGSKMDESNKNSQKNTEQLKLLNKNLSEFNAKSGILTKWLILRRINKLVYSSQSGKDKYKEIARIINEVPGVYAKITEPWRQENFVMAISVMYFLHDKEYQPDFLFPWLYQLLQHPSGVIRYAAVRMFQIELGPLTVHMRYPTERPGISGRLKPEIADRIVNTLILNLNNLLADLWKLAYKRYKYINSLPASPYKSVQMVLANLEELCERGE